MKECVLSDGGNCSSSMARLRILVLLNELSLYPGEEQAEEE
jgi:hypothetical protein